MLARLLCVVGGLLIVAVSIAPLSDGLKAAGYALGIALAVPALVSAVRRKVQEPR